MRLRTLAAAVIVLAAAASAPAQLSLGAPSPSGSYEPHAAIRIQSDAEFNATNGVRSGNGTLADPYVISGWQISAGAGTGIRINNTTSAYVIRDNLIHAWSGVIIDGPASPGTIVNNDIKMLSVGVSVRASSPAVLDNSIHYDRDNAYNPRGIVLASSNSRVEGNLILTPGVGIDVDNGSPSILVNDIHQASVGVDLSATTNATVHANVITNPRVGIYASTTITTNITFNVITTAWTNGIEVWVNKDMVVANNSVRFSGGVGVAFESTSGNFTGNVVADGKTNAVIVWHSPIVMANNTIENNLGIGFHFSQSAADAYLNTFVSNGLGIALEGESVVRLHANVLVNNTVGVSIPYESRQSILHLEGNFVNGVNIDGAVNADEQVFFYKTANVTIEGQVRDSGFSAGYYGSVSAQGGVVLYEVDTANVNASLISHHNVGVGVVNSFDVNVRGSLVLNNLVGVRAEAKAVPFQVPNCAVSVKNTTINITVDPVATFGVDAKGCLVFVVNTTIGTVDTGIRYDGAASGAILNTTVNGTAKIGLDLAGRGVLNVTGNTISANPTGMRLYGTNALVVENRFVGNAGAGIRLEAGASLDLRRNNVSFNGQGVIDARACLGPASCSTVLSEDNWIGHNRGDGLRLNGGAQLRGDTLVANRGHGAALASATLLRVRAEGNEASGARVVGTFTVRDSTFTANGAHGFELVGEGDLRDSSFTRNREAGIRATATAVQALRLNVSDNLDGILFDELFPRAPTDSLSIPGLLGLLPSLTSNAPLQIHISTLLGNDRDAIRVGDVVVDATYNHFGPLGPRVNVQDSVGAYQNGVSPTVRFVPWFADEGMTTTGPAPGL